MKTLYFLPNGIMDKAALERQFDESRLGNKITFCNGSLNKGFQDSCDKVILGVENRLIEDWAVSKGIEIERAYEEKEQEADKEKESQVAAPVAGIDNEDVDSLYASQVAKSLVEVSKESDESTEDEAKEHQVPEFKDIKAGMYKDPEGNVFERKPQGSKLKGNFTEAIKKFGFEAFEKVD